MENKGGKKMNKLKWTVKMFPFQEKGMVMGHYESLFLAYKMAIMAGHNAKVFNYRN
jgi:hypothetical protein